MSGDLVARLRSVVELWTRGRNTSAFIKGTVAEAADRIEALETERDTLAKAVTEWGHYPTCERWKWLRQAPPGDGRPPHCNCPMSALAQLQGGQNDE